MWTVNYQLSCNESKAQNQSWLANKNILFKSLVFNMYKNNIGVHVLTNISGKWSNFVAPLRWEISPYVHIHTSNIKKQLH